MARQETLAAVDLGSNSFHLQIGRVVEGQIYPLDSLREHAAVEREDAELAVQEVRTGQVSFHRGRPRERRAGATILRPRCDQKVTMRRLR